MYAKQQEQIEQNIQFISYLVNALEAVRDGWDSANPVLPLAQERMLQVAIEAITDIGNLMIDGLAMRDASSYEDIVVILKDEQVIREDLSAVLLELVQLRKPLMQQYVHFDRTEMHPLIPKLPVALSEFSSSVQRYLKENQ